MKSQTVLDKTSLIHVRTHSANFFLLLKYDGSVFFPDLISKAWYPRCIVAVVPQYNFNTIKLVIEHRGCKNWAGFINMLINIVDVSDELPANGFELTSACSQNNRNGLPIYCSIT